ncbi:MAG: CRTAC1 family protein, partial [Bacteroidota bacterium]
MSSNKHQLRTKSTVATRTLLKKIGYSGAILAMVVALNNSFSGLFNQQYMLIQAGNTLAVGGDLVNEDTLIIEGHLELSGDLINQEFMDCGNCQDGMVTFTNSYQNPQTIGGISPINLYQIKVLTSGGIDLENEVKIRHKVFFTGGGMRSERGNPNYFLHLFDSASIEGLSDSLHVNGYVGYTGDSTFTFPIGDGQSLRPVTIEPAGGSGFYQAAYFPHDPNQNTALAGSPFPRTAMDVSQLGAIHEQEYWDINGTEIGILTFTWNPGSHINQWLNDLQELVVVGWNGTRWESLGQTALNGDINQGSISSMPVVPNDYQAYTLGSSGSCGGNLTRLADIGLQADMGQSWNVSFGDYDNDGYEDVFVGEFFHWKGNYLYKNNQDGTFSRVSVGDLTSDKGATGGSTWGDFDNDGDLDIFVANVVRADNHLYENNGDGTFTRLDAGDVSHYAGYCHNASWVDYNNDGLLDIFASDYMPTRYNQLYHNNGDGTFSSATDNPIALEAKFSMGATWGDYDNDGLLDLFVPNGRNAHNSLYHNDGNGKFTKIASGPVVTDGGNSGGSSWADVDNDGDLDLYVTNASNQPNFFYLNQGDGTFVKNTTSIIATEAGHSHGSAWGDIDNDGDQDLYVTNDQNKVNRLYLNDGSGNFTLAAGGINSDTDNSFAAAFADIDNDGDLDLLSGNVNEINTLYQNQSSLCSNWKCIKLVGTKSNRAAIGAKIRVKATVNGQSFWQLREISGQTGGGSSAQNSLKAHFGLG